MWKQAGKSLRVGQWEVSGALKKSFKGAEEVKAVVSGGGEEVTVSRLPSVSLSAEVGSRARAKALCACVSRRRG